MMPPAGGVVWLASFPKSGNTWLRILLANLLSPDDGPVDINRIRSYSRALVGRPFVEDVTLVDSSLLTGAEVDLLSPRVVESVAAQATGRLYVKTHDAYRRNGAGESLFGRGEGRVALYIIRDPRDVAVSLSHHNNISLDVAIERLNSPHYTLCDSGDRWTDQIPQRLTDWSGHVVSWTEQRDLPMHVLRYEDLQADAVGVFGAAVAFLGDDVPRAAVERAVRASDFAELRRQEQRAGFNERRWKSNSPFFRVGRVDAWREVLTPAQEQAIVAVHRPVMARFGYT